MTGQFSANASMLGYQYQIRYALYLLFKAGRHGQDQALALEALDDISFESNGTPLELIQTKHRAATADLTDTSADLWKTLRVWCTYAQTQTVTDITLSLITTSPTVAGSVAEMLKPTGQRDIPCARQQLTAVAVAGANQSLRSSYDAFLALSVPAQDALLRQVMVIDDSERIQDLPRQIKMFLSYTAAPQHIDDLFEHLEGWWIQRSIDMLLSPPDAPLTVRASELKRKVVHLGHAYSETSLPDDFPKIIEMDESELGPHERTFVTQLRLVLNSESRLRHAIGQYYRAYNQRSKWLEAGLVDDDELDRYTDYLYEEWLLEFERIQDEVGDLPDPVTLKQLGLRLFNWADRKDWRSIRRDYDNGAYPRGSLHILANAQRVGWHPQFREELTKLMVRAAGAAS